MILYHYTAYDLLDSILEEGLRFGDLPISPRRRVNGVVWLTTDRNPDGHGLPEGGELSKEQKSHLGIRPTFRSDGRTNER